MSRSRQSRRSFVKALGLGGCCLALGRGLSASAAEEAAKSRRPNFIFFFTDDQGWQDLGCFGHPYLKTPNMDRLARGGTRFEHFYSAASVCSPSRAAVMTGHYPARHRIHQHFSDHTHNSACGMPDWLDPKAVTVTRLLQKAGYRTGHFGKWHLGHTPGAPEPGEYGIDEYRTLCGTGPGWDRNGKPAETDLALASANHCTDKDRFWTHSAELFVEQGIDFIEKNKGRPFYLNLWMILPHTPILSTPEQLAEYEDLRADPDDFDSWMREYLRKAKNPQQKMKSYCAVVTSIDVALGRLLDKLDELGLADNTVILFTSDNGPEDYAITSVSNPGVGSPGVLRARKRSLYEGGVRMPCVVRWPGRVPAGRVDKTSVLSAVDWLPTVCGLAGVNVPDIRPDGEDVSDILMGKSRPRKGPLFWQWRGSVLGAFRKQYEPPRLAVREGQWKLFANDDGKRVELYDIPADPAEKTDLAEKNPEVVARLLPKLLGWKKTLPK